MAALKPLYYQKLESARKRAELLSQLQETVSIPAAFDLDAVQWRALNFQLAASSQKLLALIRKTGDSYLQNRGDETSTQKLAERIGNLEVGLTGAYNFYDTFMDILTQRCSPELGALLKGCDALAFEALQKGGVDKFTVKPVVYCDRGFGASTLREGVSAGNGIDNPVPIIGIPYSRLSEKHNLFSIYHEVGHQTLTKLGLVDTLSQAVETGMGRKGVHSTICKYFASWSRELGPDFWAFGLSGMGQTASVRDVLVLPPEAMFSFSGSRQHPPAYIRFLVSVEWCRQIWGAGTWDLWAKEWEEIYNGFMPEGEEGTFIKKARQAIPVFATTMLHARFRKIEKKKLSDLFDLNSIDPVVLRSYTKVEDTQKPAFEKMPYGVQLSVYRLLQEQKETNTATLGDEMTRWLKNLNSNKKQKDNGKYI